MEKNEKEKELSDTDRNMTMPREQVQFNKDKFCLRCFIYSGNTKYWLKQFSSA